MKGKYIEIIDIPDFNKMDFYTYRQIKEANRPNPYDYGLAKEEREKAWLPNPYKKYIGIYFLMNGDELVYIGKTTKLADRLTSHNGDTMNKKEFDSIFFLPIEKNWELDVLERCYIEMYKPKYNKAMEWI